MPRNLLFALPALLLAISFSACVSTPVDPDADSDLPWNVQQSWEGAPGIPGFDGR